MGVSGLYYPHAIALPSGTVITQLSDVTPSRNFTDLTERSASEPGPNYTGSEQGAPDITFGTPQLDDILAEFSGNDPVIADLSGGNVDVEYRKGADKSTRVATASLAHVRARLQSNAALAWLSLSAEDGRQAQGQFRLVPVFDGTNDPMAVTASQALTLSAAIGNFFTLGPVVVNGTTLNGVESMNWDNGLQFNELHGDGEEWLSHFSVNTYAPTIRVRLRDTATFATYGSKGTALSALVVYLRKRVKSGINVPEATVEHIKLSASAGTIKPISIGANGPELMIQLHATPGSAMFAINTASAIT